MQLKRTLIVAFAVLSLVAIWDMATSGPGSFGRIFDQTFGQIDMGNVRLRQDRPDFETARRLEPVGGVRRVAVESTIGRLEVTRSERPEVTAEYTVRVWGSGDLAAFAEDVVLAWRQEGDAVHLTFDRPRRLPRGVEEFHVDVRLALPDGVGLAAVHAGDTSIQGLTGAVELEHRSGVASVEGVRGPVQVSSRFADVRIARVAGPVRAGQSGGRLTLREIEGPVEGELRFGELNLDRVAGDVTFTLHQGTASIETVGGDLDLQGGYGEAKVAGVAGDVMVDFDFGSVSVTGIRRAADLSLNFGDLKVGLEGEGGWTVTAVAQMGDIQTDLALERRQSGPRVELSGVIGDGAHRLNLSVQQGSLRLTR